MFECHGGVTPFLLITDFERCNLPRIRGEVMIQFQKNKWFHFAAILLLVGFAALTFHPLIHALHHDGDKNDADHCSVCQFVMALGLILFCIFLLFLRTQQERFNFSEFKQFLPFKFLSPIHGRAPPSLS